MGKVNCTVRGEDWGWPMKSCSGGSTDPYPPQPEPPEIPALDPCKGEVPSPAPNTVITNFYVDYLSYADSPDILATTSASGTLIQDGSYGSLSNWVTYFLYGKYSGSSVSSTLYRTYDPSHQHNSYGASLYEPILISDDLILFNSKTLVDMSISSDEKVVSVYDLSLNYRPTTRFGRFLIGLTSYYLRVFDSVSGEYFHLRLKYAGSYCPTVLLALGEYPKIYITDALFADFGYYDMPLCHGIIEYDLEQKEIVNVWTTGMYESYFPFLTNIFLNNLYSHPTGFYSCGKIYIVMKSTSSSDPGAIHAFDTETGEFIFNVAPLWKFADGSSKNPLQMNYYCFEPLGAFVLCNPRGEACIYRFNETGVPYPAAVLQGAYTASLSGTGGNRYSWALTTYNGSCGRAVFFVGGLPTNDISTSCGDITIRTDVDTIIREVTPGTKTYSNLFEIDIQTISPLSSDWRYGVKIYPA